MRLIIGIALLVGGMAVSIGAPAEARDARLLAARGIDTTAEVTDVTITAGGSRFGDLVLVDVEYEDEFGLSAQASDIIYCGEEDALAVGERVEITYDPEESAPPQFTACPQSQEITIPLIIGITALAIGVVCVLSYWRYWRRRWWGIPLLLLGILFVAASFAAECECPDFVWTGSALVILGIAPLVVPRRHHAA